MWNLVPGNADDVRHCRSLDNLAMSAVLGFMDEVAVYEHDSVRMTFLPKNMAREYETIARLERKQNRRSCKLKMRHLATSS